ncbi:competence protein ComK [Virgibacillus oceani]
MGEGASSVYTITQRTKAIMHKESAYYRSLILEGNKERYSIHKPEHIIKNSCLIYGTNLDGGKQAVKDILNSSSKLPISIVPEGWLLMLPTASMKNRDCVYIAYHHINFYEQRDDKTYIAFHDGTGIYVNISESIFDIQYKRTSQVIVHLNWGVIFGRANYKWRAPDDRL